jgi:hypothetical protein
MNIILKEENQIKNQEQIDAKKSRGQYKNYSQQQDS